MASGIFLLLDDIAMLADDVAVASKMATQKTAAILGDDLAVNAQKATGFDQSRELKVIWAITKGSLKNKAIILPVAFVLTAFAPFLITIILVLGALFLLYEGVEKIEEYLFHKKEEVKNEELLNATKENILEIEKEKIKSAVLTDFILSIEIVVIALAAVSDKPFLVQVSSTVIVALIATFGVYGLVAMIVRMDNVGFWLIEKKRIQSGNLLISAMPKLIKTLAFVGTFAMILVGGGILSHKIEFFHHYYLESLPALTNDLFIGLIIGVVVLFVVKIFHILKNKIRSS
jgi:predicted DNA repair protein MutK